MSTIAYVYLWRHIPSLMWYIGSRTKVGCHPEDGYICSSKVVKPLITRNSAEWERTIIATGNPKEMRKVESELLSASDAKNDIRSYNKHNGDGKFTTTGKISSDEHRLKISQGNTGKKRSPEAKENYKKANQAKAADPSYIAKLRKPKHPGHGAKVSAATTGVKKTAEHCASLSKAKKGIKTGPCSDLRKKAISEGLKRKYDNHTNPNKGKTYEDIYGEEKATELKNLRSLAFKEARKNAPVYTCPHCSIQIKGGNYKRYHGDKCRNKNNVL